MYKKMFVLCKLSLERNFIKITGCQSEFPDLNTANYFIRAIYTEQNKSRLTYDATFVRRELDVYNRNKVLDKNRDLSCSYLSRVLTEESTKRL